MMINMKISPSSVLHLPVGYQCIRQGLQKYTEFNIIICDQRRIIKLSFYFPSNTHTYLFMKNMYIFTFDITFLFPTTIRQIFLLSLCILIYFMALKTKLVLFVHRIQFKQANMPKKAREGGGRIRMVNMKISPSWVLHLTVGYPCIRQGVQR